MRPTTATDDNVFDFQALLHPGTVFEHPRDVVTHPSLTMGEKRAIQTMLRLASDNIRTSPRPSKNCTIKWQTCISRNRCRTS